MTVSDELDRTWRETVGASIKTLFQNFLRGSAKNSAKPHSTTVLTTTARRQTST